ncbi:MAG TPA: hypothetical protein VGC79_22580 [Polyangiaceae bacterium]
MTAVAATNPESDATVLERLHDLIAWSWGALTPELKDGRTDPTFVFPYLASQANTFYFELHFEDARVVRTDFLQQAPLNPGASVANPSVDPILASMSRWYAGGDTAARCHHTTWLELDGPLQDSGADRRQGVSVCLDPHFGTPAEEDPLLYARSASHLVSVFERLQQACAATPQGAPVLGRASDAAVTSGGLVRHVSVMRGRPGAPSKLYASLTKPTFPRFLRDIAWPGDLSEAERFAGVVCTESKRVNCDLEFTNQLTERIGFEIFNDPSPAFDLRRRAATDRALAMGLISTVQVAGLESWVGLFRKQLGNQRWPTRIQRWFDVKFVIHPGGRREFKAYLGFRLREGIF